MRKIILMAAVMLYVVSTFSLAYSQEKTKYVIFTCDDKESINGEGIYRFNSKPKSESFKNDIITFYFISESKEINSFATAYEFDIEKLARKRKVKEKDKRVKSTKSIEFLETIELIDMDILLSTMSKEEFIRYWDYELWPYDVYFIDRATIKNKKVTIYPVKLARNVSPF